MNYSNGKMVVLGDKVSLGGGLTGVVVAVIENKDFAKGYIPDEWLYLKTGALIESPKAGIVHYPQFSEDVALIEHEVL